jgi:plasmid stabilization system protein ParE
VDYDLFFTQRALNDLAEIIGHIADDDADAATRFGNSLLDHLDLLPRFPRMGGIIRKRSQVRKLVIARFWFTTQSRNTSAESRSSTSGMDRGSPQDFRNLVCLL